MNYEIDKAPEQGPPAKASRAERVKIWAVMGLIVVAGFVAYFRFFNKPSEKVAAATVGMIPEDVLDIPPLTEWANDGETASPSNATEAYRPIERDIFAPAAGPEDVSSHKTSGDTGHEDGAPFKLKAIMEGWGGILAKINDQALRVGEEIDGYQVTRIGNRQVTLQSGSEQLVLTVGE